MNTDDCNVAKPIRCRICKKKFATSSNYSEHWVTKHSAFDKSSMYGNPLQCVFCNRYFRTLHSVNWHKYKCAGQFVAGATSSVSPVTASNSNKCGGTKLNQNSTIGCSICSKKFAKSEFYELHWSAKHADVDRSLMYKIQRQCKICYRYFPTSYMFSLHSAKCKAVSSKTETLNANAINDQQQYDASYSSKVCKMENVCDDEEQEAMDSTTMSNNFAQSEPIVWNGSSLVGLVTSDEDSTATTSTNNSYFVNGRTIKCEPIETGVCLLGEQLTTESEGGANDYRQISANSNNYDSKICKTEICNDDDDDHDEQQINSTRNNFAQSMRKVSADGSLETAVGDTKNTSSSSKNDDFCIGGRTIKCEPIETGLCLFGELPIKSKDCDINTPGRMYAFGSAVQKPSTTPKVAVSAEVVSQSTSTADDDKTSLLQIKSQLKFPSYFDDAQMERKSSTFSAAEHCNVQQPKKKQQQQQPSLDEVNDSHYASQAKQAEHAYIPMNSSDDSKNANERVICTICGADFVNKYSYKIHFANTHDAKNVANRKKICAICGLDFVCRNDYMRHFVKKHSERIDEMFDSGWKCTLCPFVYETVKGLQTHWRLTHNDVYDVNVFRHFKNQIKNQNEKN